MSKSNVNKIRELMFDLNAKELSEVVPMIKNCRVLLNMRAKDAFSVGSHVKFSKYVGIVKKLNRTKAEVTTKSEGTWTVPMSMLEAV